MFACKTRRAEKAEWSDDLTEVRLACVTNASVSLRCCTEDGSRPPEIGLQELVSNRPVRLRSKGVVVSDRGKGIVKDVRYVLRR